MLYTDAEIIKGIRTGGVKRERCVNYLLKTHIGLMHKILIQRLKLNLDLAKDIYHDSVMKVVSQIEKGKFRREGKLSTFLYTIIQRKGFDIHRKPDPPEFQSQDVLNEWKDQSKDAFQQLIHQEQKAQIASYFKEMGQKCKKILSEWAEGFSMEEIAQNNQLKDANSAKTTRYKCFKKLLKIVTQKQKMLVL